MPGGGVTGVGGFCVVVLPAGGGAGRIWSPDAEAVEVDDVDGEYIESLVSVGAAVPPDPQAASSRVDEARTMSRGAAVRRVTRRP